MDLCSNGDKSEGHTEDRTRVMGFRVPCATATPYDQAIRTVLATTSYLVESSVYAQLRVIGLPLTNFTSNLLLLQLASNTVSFLASQA